MVALIYSPLLTLPFYTVYTYLELIGTVWSRYDMLPVCNLCIYIPILYTATKHKCTPPYQWHCKIIDLRDLVFTLSDKATNEYYGIWGHISGLLSPKMLFFMISMVKSVWLQRHQLNFHEVIFQFLTPFSQSHFVLWIVYTTGYMGLFEHACNWLKQKFWIACIEIY